jgi:hypothetical protein
LRIVARTTVRTTEENDCVQEAPADRYIVLWRRGGAPRSMKMGTTASPKYDDVPVEAFYFSRDMTEIRGNTGRTLTFGPVQLPSMAK